MNAYTTPLQKDLSYGVEDAIAMEEVIIAPSETLPLRCVPARPNLFVFACINLSEHTACEHFDEVMFLCCWSAETVGTPLKPPHKLNALRRCERADCIC